MTELPRSTFLTCPADAFGKPVCRLGLASRGSGAVAPDDVLEAIAQGVNFLNWPGQADGPLCRDGLQAAVAGLDDAAREPLVLCVQFGARTVADARDELQAILAELRTDYIDVLTLYYVEHAEEWNALAAPGGVLEYLEAARRDGVVRQIGLTSHQRQLAARIAETGRIDALMLRYNAAHRGVERDIFPVVEARGLPLIAYTALRWGALLQPTPDDPPAWTPPPVVDWYRFALQAASVSVVLAAPASRHELDEDLRVLDVAGPMDDERYRALAEHGQRVRRHAGRFP
ncbi:MAG: aldo/keto reductase [Pirellulales bacterium]